MSDASSSSSESVDNNCLVVRPDLQENSRPVLHPPSISHASRPSRRSRSRSRSRRRYSDHRSPQYHGPSPPPGSHLMQYAQRSAVFEQPRRHSDIVQYHQQVIWRRTERNNASDGYYRPSGPTPSHTVVSYHHRSREPQYSDGSDPRYYPSPNPSGGAYQVNYREVQHSSGDQGYWDSRGYYHNARHSY